MKKLISNLFLVGGLLLITQSCKAQSLPANKELGSAAEGKMLVGAQSLSQFQNTPYSDWFKPQRDNYAVHAQTIEALKNYNFNDYNVTVFLGTWCGDSHRDFPIFMKIAEALNYPESKLTIIAVDRQKQSPEGEQALYNITRVPTFIVSKGEKEVGRIVEYSTSGYVEKDLLEIIKRDKTPEKDVSK